VQLVQKMIDGVSKVIEIEERLAAGETPESVERWLSRKAFRGSLVKKKRRFHSRLTLAGARVQVGPGQQPSHVPQGPRRYGGARFHRLQ
jgi:hypothetical protein